MQLINEHPVDSKQKSEIYMENLSNNSIKVCIRRRDTSFINHFITNEKKQNTSENKTINSKKRVAQIDTVSDMEEDKDNIENLNKKRSKHEKKQKKNKIQENVNKSFVINDKDNVKQVNFDLENELDTCFENFEKENFHSKKEILQFVEKIKSELKEYEENNAKICNSDLFVAKLIEEINYSILNDLWLAIRENVFKKFNEKHNCQLYWKIFDKLFHKGKQCLAAFHIIF